MFAWFLAGKITRSTLKEFLDRFGNDLGIASQYHINHVVQTLANIETRKYDCCPSSCVAYTGPYTQHTHCPKCRHARFKSSGKPYGQFTYIPLIPRLQAYFSSPAMAELLAYRTRREPEPGSQSDIFDGAYFQHLIQTPVTINGNRQKYRYFEDENDIALGMMGDGVRVFKHGNQSMWPVILLNYALPPEVRTHIPYLIPLMLIPGPHQPKDHNSFVYPFRDEMMQLAKGIPTFHCIKREMFILRAYLLTVVGDLQAFKLIQYIKGPNAFSPCRTCRLQGCRDPTQKIYYYPLNPPPGAIGLDHDTSPTRWNPHSLPMRTHQSYKESLQYILNASTQKESDRRSKTQGITGESILVNLPGFDRAQGGPHDFMHLMYENIIPTLIHFWTGMFRLIDHNDEPYVIPSRVWATVGQETQAATKCIPSFFCRTLPDISANPGLYIAESWAFWYQYLMPYLLDGRLPTTYYRHALDLVDIIKLCLQFSITSEQIQELERRIIKWVQDYER